VSGVSVRFELPTLAYPGASAEGSGCDITEQRPCAFPLVYGFVRVPGSRRARWNALDAAIRMFCHQHELTLGDVFVEQCGLPNGSGPAFSSLLTTLAMPDTYGVVLPSTAHLGRRDVAMRRRNQLEHIGVRLLVIRDRDKYSRAMNNS
jgi:hypothetical protein